MLIYREINALFVMTKAKIGRLNLVYFGLNLVCIVLNLVHFGLSLVYFGFNFSLD